MDKIIYRIRNFRFKGLLVILLVFLLIATILLIELSGVNANQYTRALELLPRDKTITKNEAFASLNTKTLLLRDSGEQVSTEAYENVFGILKDMKVGYRDVDLSVEAVPSFEGYSEVIVLLTDLTPMGNSVIKLTEWVKSGGAAWFPLTLETNSFSSPIFQIIGIDDMSPDYYTVKKIHVKENYMVGGGRAFAVSDPFECAKTVVLSKHNTEVYASADTDDGVPLVWKTKYGEGTFVVDNIGMYEKALRGFYAASYSLLSDVCVYPVINASVFYLDDFPSQIPDGNSEYIQRDYNTTIRDFYINVWWQDMMNFADQYGLKYTGLAIESYNDDVDGTTNAKPDTSTFLNFGNMLLRKGGELGYHGYNHQPLCLGNIDYKNMFTYKTWQSEAAMKSAFDHLVNFCDDLFPDTEFSLYVPPSNFLSAEGRAFLLREYPNIRTISGVYFDDIDYEGMGISCLQEFDVDSSGVVDQPRVISGFILDDFQTLASVSELNLHFINSHFTHPDDALDVERGAALGWEEMKRRFDGYLSWLYTSAPTLRNLTGTETSAAVQRYVAAVPHTTVTANSVNVTIDNFYDELYLFVRFNEKSPAEVRGGTLEHLTGDLYLLCATEAVVDITLK